MASGPITSWQIDGKTVSDFIFLGSKITADGDCSHEIKRRLLLGRKAVTNLDSILESKYLTLSTKVHLVEAGHVWMWELDCEEGWVPKNWCFWTVVLEKTLESPLDCKEIQQVHSEGDQPFLWKEWCWSWNSSTLATSCKELTHWKRLWCWEGLGARGEGNDRGWDGWMASLTRWTWVLVNSGSWWWTGRPGVLWFMGSQRVGHDWATELTWFLLSGRLHHRWENRKIRKKVLVAQLCPTHCDPMTVAHQAPPFMEFSRQEHWSGLPFPSPGHLPNPGIEPRSPILQAGSLPSESPGKPSGK